jgi:lipooligosaccharide transport system ATP-binding protein
VEPIIQVTRLVKRYGALEAVKGISFQVAPGECFGILGPNGAGKSSTIRVLTAVSPFTSGEVRVAGMDVRLHPREVKATLGVVPQEETLDPDPSVLGNLVAHARYYRIPRAEASERARDALSFLKLLDRAGDRVDTLSGGIKRRLVIARALMNRPRVLVLDEPTTGLDPMGRHIVWERLLELRRQGVTILLSTHNMEEATALCQRLVIMDLGVILAEGPPRDLVLQHSGGEVLEVRPPLGQAGEVQERLLQRGLRVEAAGTALLVFSPDGDALERELTMEGLQALHRPGNLEDVFLRLTGRGLEEEED